MLVRIANMEDPDQTASKSTVDQGNFGWQLVFEILEHLSYLSFSIIDVIINFGKNQIFRHLYSTQLKSKAIW